MSGSGLAEFVKTEMDRYGDNVTTFAKRVGVSHSTISHLLADEIKDPKFSLLKKLARGTNTNFFTFIARISPDVVTPRDVAEATAERIESLPPKQRELVDMLLRNILKDDNQRE